MLYRINGKFYIKVQGYYIEVNVNLEGDNLDVTPKSNGEKIEIYGFQEVVEPIDMMTDKYKIIESLKSTRIDNRKEEKSRFKSRI